MWSSNTTKILLQAYLACYTILQILSPKIHIVINSYGSTTERQTTEQLMTEQLTTEGLTTERLMTNN